MGILFRFFNSGAGVLHCKAVPGVGILMEKIAAQGLALGDGTSRIDTCIRAAQVWPRLRYGLGDCGSWDCGSLVVGHYS